MKNKVIVIMAILGIVLMSGCVEIEQQGTPEEVCLKTGTGEKLSLTEAKEIALSSGCVKGLVCCEIYGLGAFMKKVNVRYEWTTPQECTIPEGFVGGGREIVKNEDCEAKPLTEKYFCNSVTGTWWIDLNVEKNGCSPACVINVATREAKINWRCTGLLPLNESLATIKAKESVKLAFEAAPSEIITNPYVQSELQIASWSGNKILRIEEYANLNCAEEVKGGGFEVTGDNITLLYVSPKCGKSFSCARGMCTYKLVYLLSDLEKKNYSIEFKRVEHVGQGEEPLGGEKDEHECLLMAGYTWNEEANACIREWELNENQKKAAKIAVDYIGYEKGVTILGVLVARCPGCFLVKLEKGKDRIEVTLDDWEVKGKTLTPDECLAKGGRTVNIVGGASCEEDEINIGKVTGFISPNICCVASS